MLTAPLLASLAVISSLPDPALCDTVYKPTWDSLDTRPLPPWYDEVKFGVFISWGLFAVPSYGNEWFWHKWKTDKEPDLVKFMEANYPPGFTYEDFAPMFKAELFDPEQWADVVEASGAKYVNWSHCLSPPPPYAPCQPSLVVRNSPGSLSSLKSTLTAMMMH